MKEESGHRNDSDQRLADGLDAAELGFWTWDIPNDLLSGDPRVAFLFGIDERTAARTRAETYIRRVEPEDRTRMREGLAKVLSTGGAYSLEYRVRGSDGIVRWLASRGRAELDVNHQPKSLNGVVFDVTDLNKTRKHLLDSEERLRLATDAAELGLWVWDVAEDRVTWENDRLYEIFGLPRTEAPINVRRFLAEFVHPEDLLAFHAALACTLETGTRFHFLGRFRNGKGALGWIEFTGLLKRSPDGKPEKVVGTATSVSAQKWAEQTFTFVQGLDDAVRKLTDPREITATAARLLGQHLEVNRCAYAVVADDEDSFELTGDYNRGVPSIVGRYAFHQFGEECLRLMREGLPYVVDDSEQDPRTGQVREAYRATLVRSVVCVPIKKEARFVAAIAVHQNTQRHWLQHEVELVQQVASRCWESIERARVAHELQESEQRSRFLAESIPQMVWTAGADGMLDYVNEQGARYFGLPQKTLLGAGWLDGVHPEDQERTISRWTASLETGTPYETQFRLRRGRDGSWRSHLVRAIPFRAEEGAKVTKWFGTCTDIEDQQQASRQIEEDRRRWRALLLQTPAAIALLRGSKHVIDWVNPEYERLVGRSAGVLLGKPLLEAQPELGSQVYAEHLDRVFRSGQPFRETEAHVQLGATVLRDSYVNFVYLPTRDLTGAIDGIFAHITDVTATVAARKTIEESEGQFRVLAETIPHLTWMADETGHIFWYNQRWFDYTGTTLDEMSGWGWQSVHDPEVLPAVIARWTAHLASGEPFEMIFPLRRSDGEFRAFLTRVEPIRDRQGRVVRWFGTNTDIADQRRIEEDLRRTNRHLEEFSYVASHDLQEPLRMVNIYAQLLLEGGPKETQDVYAGFVAEGVKRMEALIQDLLAFSRSVHAEEPRVGTANLTIAFNDALAVLKNRIDEAGAVIHCAKLPVTRGDASQMTHVFQNILSNALKYRKTEIPPEIQVGAEKSHRNWVISIRDNGIGFDPQYADQVFGLFKRLHGNEYPGTGLGLAICKRIVERYGGSIHAESAIGRGSTFHISLPVAQAE